MAITGIGSTYSNVYENIYASSKKEEMKETAGTQKSVETVKKNSNEEYLKNLQKQVSYMKLQVGNGVNTKNDGKVNVLDINPKLLEKMQNDPKAAKEYTQRLKDVEAATKYVDSFEKSMGYTAICRHGYIDENGNFSNFAVVVRKDELNERLRKEAQENTEEQIEKSREKAREKAEQLAERTAEKAEETKESDKKKDKTIISMEKGDTTKDKAEKLLTEKWENSKNGEVVLDNEDVQTIIEAVKDDDAGKANAKGQMSWGKKAGKGEQIDFFV